MDQKSALRLAICNDIGQASYDPVIAAKAMLELVRVQADHVIALAPLMRLVIDGLRT